MGITSCKDALSTKSFFLLRTGSALMFGCWVRITETLRRVLFVCVPSLDFALLKVVNMWPDSDMSDWLMLKLEKRHNHRCAKLHYLQPKCPIGKWSFPLAWRITYWTDDMKRSSSTLTHVESVHLTLTFNMLSVICLLLVVTGETVIQKRNSTPSTPKLFRSERVYQFRASPADRERC